MSHSDLSSIDTELLATVVKKLEQVSINNNHLTSDQIVSILKPCAENESNLKTLILRNTRLADIDPELLSAALKNIKKMNLIVAH